MNSSSAHHNYLCNVQFLDYMSPHVRSKFFFTIIVCSFRPINSFLQRILDCFTTIFHLNICCGYSSGWTLTHSIHDWQFGTCAAHFCVFIIKIILTIHFTCFTHYRCEAYGHCSLMNVLSFVPHSGRTAHISLFFDFFFYTMSNWCCQHGLAACYLVSNCKRA